MSEKENNKSNVVQRLRSRLSACRKERDEANALLAKEKLHYESAAEMNAALAKDLTTLCATWFSQQRTRGFIIAARKNGRIV